jgi:hypothetical protein
MRKECGVLGRGRSQCYILVQYTGDVEEAVRDMAATNLTFTIERAVEIEAVYCDPNSLASGRPGAVL